jgi:hypothetical protein
MWRRRILLKPIIEVSDREKKNESKTRIENKINVTGMDITGYIG